MKAIPAIRIKNGLCGRAHPRSLWVGLLMLALMPVLASAQQIEWFSRFGAPGIYDEAFAVATDSTGVYVTGRGVRGAPTGSTDFNAYVRKCSFAGKVIWTRQFDVFGQTAEPFAIAVDGQGLYVAGRAWGAGAFVSRLDLAGNIIWSHVFDYRKLTDAWAIAVHRTGIYVAGYAYGDVYALARLDFDGNEVWATRPAVGTTPNEAFLAVTVDDTGVYGVGVIGAADVRKFDFNGQEVARFGDGTFQAGSIAQDSAGVYTVGQGSEMYSRDFQIRKYDRSGALSWKKALQAGGSLALDGSGLYLSSNNFELGGGYVSKFTLNGDFVWQGPFGERLYTYGAAVHEGDVYLVGPAFGATEAGTDSFIARFSATKTPELLSLGAIDGSPCIATLIHDATVPRVVVRVQNAVTRKVISRVNFWPQFHPQELTVVPDRNGNGAPELVLLGIHETTGNVAAQVRDSRSGALLNTVSFNKTYMPRRIAVVTNTVNEQVGLAVLGASNIDRTYRVTIKDSVTRAVIGSVRFNRDYIEPLTDLTVIPDTNGNGSPELAVGGLVMDTLSGEMISEMFFESEYCQRDYAVVPDQDGNGLVELAALLQGCTGGTARVQADIRDTLTGNQSAVLWYGKLAHPVALMVMPDFDGNRVQELGVLALNVSTDKDVLSIQDLTTHLWTHSVVFSHEGYRHRDLTLLPDVNGNGRPDVAQLQERRSDRKLRVVVKDGQTGVWIHVLN